MLLMLLSTIVLIQLALSIFLSIKIVFGLIQNFLNSVISLLRSGEKAGSTTCMSIHINGDILHLLLGLWEIESAVLVHFSNYFIDSNLNY